MTDQVQDLEPPVRPHLTVEERVAADSAQREDATTENFPIPGWSHLVWVRLKVIGPKKQADVIDANQRVPGQNRNLANAADLILAATDGFLEVNGNGEEDELEECQTSWHRLALAAHPQMGDNVTERQALIRFIGPERILAFAGQYTTWLTGERPKLVEAQRRDFQVTS